MRQHDYAVVPMTEADWIEFNDLQTVAEMRAYLLELMRQAQQKGR